MLLALFVRAEASMSQHISNASLRKCLIWTEPPLKEASALQLMGVGADGASVMAGEKSGVLTRLAYDRPFMIAHHCAAHRAALAAKALAELPFGGSLLGCTPTICPYFFMAVITIL